MMRRIGGVMEISRRQSLAKIGAAALGSLLPSRVKSAAGPSRGSPNILFILADDLGYADLSCYGRRDYSTPQLDRLARQGMRFTDAYANSPVCSPTRVALLSGRYQYRLPVGLEEPLGARRVGFPARHPTMASLLRGAGYETSLIGKWHLGPLPDFDPLRSGYNRFWGFRGGGIDYFTHKIGGKHDLWEGPVPINATGYLTDLLADRAIKEMGRAKASGKPFFLSLHFSAPHWPWEGPNDVDEAVRLDGMTGNPVPQFHFDGGSLATYAAMVERLDFQVGRVLESLKSLGVERETIVVFTSDNGGERFSDTWPFSGKKLDLLEGGIRVPAIVRWPERISSGSTSRAQILSMDWMPTFLAAAGVDADRSFPLDGIDISSAFIGGSLPERPLFWRYKNRAQQAVRLNDWKYLKVADNTFLFNLARDPLERANLKLREPRRYEDLVSKWNKWNETMLPLDAESATKGFAPSELAEHYGK